MAGTVHVRGLRETVRAFNKLDRSLSRELGDELKKAAEPVKQAAEQKIARFQGVGKVRIRRRTSTVSVEQSARKVTGLRGDFGSTQMRVGFVPALEENADDVRKGVEDALDRFARGAGF